MLQPDLADLMCPISREVFIHPLLCTDGFSYEEPLITKWIADQKLSPMLGTTLESTQLRENTTLLACVNVFKGLQQRIKKRKPIPKSETKETNLPYGLKAEFELALNHYYKSTLELDQCCNIVAKIYNAAPNNFDVVMNYANILRFSAEFDKALLITKKLKKIRSGTLIPKYMKIRIVAESGKKDKAAEYLKKLQNNNRIEDHMLIELRFMSYSLLSTSNRDLALTIISQYLKVVPKDARAISHYIYVNLLKENYYHVIGESEKYLKSNPDDISILFHQAKAYSRIGKKDEAVKIYSKIISLSLDKSVKAKALYESANNRNVDTDFEIIVKQLEESYHLDPREEADGYLAALYADKKMYDKAEEWINICASRVDIMNDQIYLGIKVQIDEYKKQYDVAINSYIRLAEIDSANSSYYNNKIEVILQRMNDSNSN